MTRAPGSSSHGAEQVFCSIVMPAFNAVSTIRAAVESVRAQTSDAWRLIVVDDGSDDDTPLVVRGYGARDDRISLVRRNHLGPAEARNAGVGLTDTDYVAFLDADDELEPGYVAAMQQAVAARPGYDIYHPNLTVVPSTGSPSLFSARTQAGETTFEELLRECVIAVGGALVRRDLFLRLDGFRSGIHCEDYDFWLRVTAQGARALYVPSPLYIYHQNLGSRRSEDVLAGAEDLVVSLTSLIEDDLVQAPLRPAVEDAIARRREHVVQVAREQELAAQAERLKNALEKRIGPTATGTVLSVAHRFTWLTRPLRGMLAERRKKRALAAKADSLAQSQEPLQHRDA